MVDEQAVSLDLWDTGGGKDYYRLCPINYPETDILVLCYSIEYPSSFENIKIEYLP